MTGSASLTHELLSAAAAAAGPARGTGEVRTLPRHRMRELPGDGCQGLGTWEELYTY